MSPVLKPTVTPGARAVLNEVGVWHLEIPLGPKGKYRLAQLDDYSFLPRRAFTWHQPLAMTLRARACTDDAIPGTWGFGLWNDPFSLSLGFGGGTRRLPALPNAAWFFFASPPNYLSLRDDLPAQGSLAAAFQSPNLPPVVLAPAALAVPLLVLPYTSRLLRRVGRRIVRQDAVSVQLNPSEWHTYRIEWGVDRLTFQVDGESVLESAVVPPGPLGLVLWIDNQFAALPPDGRLSFGTLSNSEPAWIEISDLAMNNIP